MSRLTKEAHRMFNELSQEIRDIRAELEKDPYNTDNEEYLDHLTGEMEALISNPKNLVED